MQPKDKYTYKDAGFNGFMLRSMKSNPLAQTIRGGVSAGTGKPMAFDRMQLAGGMGDSFRLGRLLFNGSAGRIVVLDENGTNEVGWIGDLTD